MFARSQRDELGRYTEREERRRRKAVRKWEKRVLGRRSVKLHTPALTGEGTTCLVCDGPLGFAGDVEIGGAFGRGTKVYIRVRPRPRDEPRLMPIGRLCSDCEQVVRDADRSREARARLERLAERAARAAAPRGSLGAALSGR